MQLTEDQIKKVEELAYCLMKPHEIAIILGLDSTAFKNQLRVPNSQVYLAFYAGYYLSKSEINESIVSHATAGSSPAQTLATRFITDIDISLDD